MDENKNTLDNTESEHDKVEIEQDKDNLDSDETKLHIITDAFTIIILALIVLAVIDSIFSHDLKNDKNISLSANETEYNIDKTYDKVEVSEDERKWLQEYVDKYRCNENFGLKGNYNVTINNDNVELPILGSKLTSLGYNALSTEKLISWSESFGQYRIQNETHDKIGVGYINHSDNSSYPDDTVVAYIECPSECVKINNIEIGDTLEECLNKLNINNSNNITEDNTDYNNISLKYNNNEWVLRIQISDEINTDISKIETRYETGEYNDILKGGLYDIEYILYGSNTGYSGLRINIGYDNIESLRHKYWQYNMTK